MGPFLRPPSGEDLECTNCGRSIKAGDEAIDFFHGVAVPDRDNGGILEVETSAALSGPAVLHPKCLVEYILLNVWDDPDGLYSAEPGYCAGCETKLAGNYSKDDQMAQSDQIWKHDVNSLREDNASTWRLMYAFFEKLKTHGAPPALVQRVVAASDKLGEVNKLLEEIIPYFPEQPPE